MNTQTVLLIVFGVVVIGCLFVAVKLLEARKAGLASEDEGSATADENTHTPRVTRRQWLLDDGSEAKFFGVLETAVAQVHGTDTCRVMIQMPLVRLAEPAKGLSRSESQKLRNRLDRKTVDYVVCKASNLGALFAVELDGSSHDATSRRERDGFVDAVLTTAGVPLVRFDRRKHEPTVNEVAERLRQIQGAAKK